MTIGKALENIFVLIISMILLIAWLMGFVINGSWWNIIPLCAWYNVVEKVMEYYHFLGYAL